MGIKRCMHTCISTYCQKFISLWKCPSLHSHQHIHQRMNAGVLLLFSHVLLFAAPWTVTPQAPLYFTIFWSLLKFMSTESGMLSNHLILCCPLLLLPSSFPASRSFPMSQLLASGQSIGASASATVFPMNTKCWSPLGLTGLILQSRGNSGVFSTNTIQKH